MDCLVIKKTLCYVDFLLVVHSKRGPAASSSNEQLLFTSIYYMHNDLRDIL
jgi:hypothetical protein